MSKALTIAVLISTLLASCSQEPAGTPEPVTPYESEITIDDVRVALVQVSRRTVFSGAFAAPEQDPPDPAG